MKRVMMVGSAEESGGGVSSVIKLMKKMPVWEKYSCYWLGTQIQRNYLWKLWYAVKAAVMAPLIMWRYDIVHFHNATDKIGLLVQMPELLIAKLYGKKIVYELHVGNQLNDNTENGLLKWCLRRCNRIILLSKRWEELFKEKFADIKVPTSVLYNAVDDIELSATRLSIRNERECSQIDRQLSVNSFDDFMAQKEKVIMMAAYFCENKGADVLLRAIKRLTVNGYWLMGWKVILMGNGEVERYKQMAEELGISEYVSFPGYLTNKEKDDVWRKASIYCMCSYNEGFPMVVLEAWANGISVVTTPVGGLPDVIEEGKNCLTFDFGDDEGLARQLRLLMENEDRRREMSEYSRKFVYDNFSLEKINKNLDNLYKEVLCV